RGAPVGAGDMVDVRQDGGLWAQVRAHENDAGTCRRRSKTRADQLAGEKADALNLNRASDGPLIAIAKLVHGASPEQKSCYLRLDVGDTGTDAGAEPALP